MVTDYFVIFLIIGCGISVLLHLIGKRSNPYDSVNTIKRYNPNGNYISASYSKATNQAHAAAVQSRVQLRDAIIDLQVDDRLIEKKKLEREIEFQRVEHEKQMLPLQLEWEWETLRLKEQVQHAALEGAKERKVDEVTYGQIMLMEGQAKVDVEKEKGLSAVRVEEHKQLKAIDVDAELAMQLNTIHAILKYKHLSFNQYDEIRQRIMALIEEEDRIQNANTSAQVKAQELALIEDAKETYKGALNEIKNRLLEAGNGEEISGIESLADLGGFSVGRKAKSEDESSTTLVRSRRREDDDS